MLRPDGVCWINLGDSYAGSGGFSPDSPSNKTSIQGVKNTGRRRNIAGKSYVGAGLKPKDLCLMPDRLALELQARGWWIRSKFTWWKCLSGGTRVYARSKKKITWGYPVSIKDLVRGKPEDIELWNGEKWTQVLSWEQSPPPDNPLEIELRSGEKLPCSKDHRWPTSYGLKRADELQIGDRILTTKLPEPDKPFSSEVFQDDDIGWFVGLYLAEGCRYKGTINISSHAKETGRFKRVKRIAKSYHGFARMNFTGGNKANIAIHCRVMEGVIETYLAGKLAKGKHLTVKCWQRSDAFLRALLGSYLEADAHWEKKTRRWRLGFTNNPYLADDLRTICARLSISLRLKRTTHYLVTPEGRKPYKGYSGQIRFEYPTGNKARDDNEIIAIGKSRGRKFYDIAVADSPNLFALASGTLTHNSSAMPESCKDRPANSHEWVIMATKRKSYWYDIDAERVEAVGTHARGGTKQGIGTLNAASTLNTAEAVTNPAGRNLRTGDFMQMSLDAEIERQTLYLKSLYDIKRKGGMLHDDDGVPIGLFCNPEGFPGTHFATFPARFVEMLINLSVPAKCCVECGKGWKRVTEKGEFIHTGGGANKNKRSDLMDKGANMPIDMPSGLHQTKTLGFAPDCECDAAHDVVGDRCVVCNANSFLASVEPCHRPGIVLDPFMGVATTGLVAQRLGVRWKGIELLDRYAEMGEERIEGENTLQLGMFGGIENEGQKAEMGM